MKAGESPFATVGAGIVILEQNTVLLVQMNYGPFRGSWILPGGRLEAHEHPEQAAVREAFEETGYSVQVDGLLSVRHRLLEDERSDIYFAFVGSLVKISAERSAPVFSSEELLAVRFWLLAECLTSEEVRPQTRLYIQMAHEQRDQSWRLTPLPTSLSQKSRNSDDVIYSSNQKIGHS